MQDNSRSTNFSSPGSISRWLEWLVRFRWLAVGLLAVLVFALELADRALLNPETWLNPLFIFKVFLYCLLLPAILLLILQSLNWYEIKQQESSQRNQLLSNLNAGLIQTRDLAGLSQFTLEFLNSHLHPANARLHLVPLSLQDTPASQSEKQARQALIEICASMPGESPASPADELPNAVISCPDEPSKKIRRYCLPLQSGPNLLGVLTLDYPVDLSLSEDQALFLRHLCPLLENQILAVESRALLRTQIQWHESELRQISRNLHDTLGQSVGFIRLKMEQIRHDFPGRRYPDLSAELERVQSVAEVAYQQVRDMLAELRPDSAVDLTTALTSLAQTYAERANFQIKVEEIGTPFPLAPLVKRQILFIFREAFSNVEKHAKARMVKLDMVWIDSTCRISLTDDGVGFILSESTQPNHYGLLIMQERAQDIAAAFSLTSEPGKGTCVHLELASPPASATQE